MSASSYRLEDMPTDTERGSKQATKNYHDIEWTPKRAAELLKLYSDSTLAMQCQSGSGNQLPGDWEDLRRPVITQVKWAQYLINSGSFFLCPFDLLEILIGLYIS